MFVDTVSIAPHVRVSKTVEKIAHFSREPRERRRERRLFNSLASRKPSDFLPRLVKPSLQVVSLADFKATRAVVESQAVEYVPADRRAFDKREAVAQEAGL